MIFIGENAAQQFMFSLGYWFLIVQSGEIDAISFPCWEVISSAEYNILSTIQL